jgi:hypothetical protein
MIHFFIIQRVSDSLTDTKDKLPLGCHTPIPRR